MFVAAIAILLGWRYWLRVLAAGAVLQTTVWLTVYTPQIVDALRTPRYWWLLPTRLAAVETLGFPLFVLIYVSGVLWQDDTARRCATAIGIAASVAGSGRLAYAISRGRLPVVSISELIESDLYRPIPSFIKPALLAMATATSGILLLQVGLLALRRSVTPFRLLLKIELFNLFVIVARGIFEFRPHRWTFSGIDWLFAFIPYREAITLSVFSVLAILIWRVRRCVESDGNDESERFGTQLESTHHHGHDANAKVGRR